jgi:hypothetical protein
VTSNLLDIASAKCVGGQGSMVKQVSRVVRGLDHFVDRHTIAINDQVCVTDIHSEANSVLIQTKSTHDRVVTTNSTAYQQI